ncbi:hypothetical protein, partial [Anaerotruncus massiliensis (ex Togo et al. 2019)]|uniref:hypothetical protein n=1 Tax=Anaerotruncus massiliensis (ex Togo et al. 2019) TaxID=1673720 RepID=UPI0027B998C5
MKKFPLETLKTFGSGGLRQLSAHAARAGGNPHTGFAAQPDLLFYQFPLETLKTFGSGGLRQLS